MRQQLQRLVVALLLCAGQPATAQDKIAPEDLGQMPNPDAAVRLAPPPFLSYNQSSWGSTNTGPPPSGGGLSQVFADQVWVDQAPVYKFQQTIVTVEKDKPDPWTPRHQHEKEQLLARMSRDAGKWSTSHPRHRLLDAIYGFLKYYDRQKEEITRLKGLYKHVSKSQKALLETHVGYSQRFIETDHLLVSNGALCKRIAEHAMAFYGVEQKEVDEHVRMLEDKGQKADKVSVSQSLKHIVRDWAEEGAYERDGTFSCIMDSLKTILPLGENETVPKILVPGAGLGRLGYDIAAAFPSQVTVNEWSMYMNIVSRFLEAHPGHYNSFVHPFLDTWSHHATARDMQRKIRFPDIDLVTAPVVLVEGDFTTVFGAQEDGAYDVVVTYFFIDTARNLLGYFDTIKRLLKPGGHWVNLGPLLYGSAPYVQLSLEEIVAVAEAMGFEFLETKGLGGCGEPTWPDKHLRTIKAVYSFDEKALTESAYKAQFWMAQKKQ
ncbi:Carnosine N-methyltransferase [Paramyrothecium foliicola]|nr:Carnosine N-methyltransferase [Paramyrothecium foliicola]